MAGISKEIITHKLGVDSSFRPIHQKRRKSAPERNQIIQEEVKRLLNTVMIREVHFPKWLANVVAVKRRTGSLESVQISQILIMTVPRIISHYLGSTR